MLLPVLMDGMYCNTNRWRVDMTQTQKERKKKAKREEREGKEGHAISSCTLLGVAMSCSTRRKKRKKKLMVYN